MARSEPPPAEDVEPFWPPDPTPRARRLPSWRSRLAASLVLLAFLGLRVADVAPLETARLWFLDLQMRLAASPSGPPTVAVVDIDENSLRWFGQWPWPRELVARLVDRLVEGGARVIVFDILFAEADRLSPAHLADELPGLPPELREDLARLGDSTTRLAEAMQRIPTVTASAVIDHEATAAEASPPSRIASRGGDVGRWLPDLGWLIRSRTVLEQAGVGDGVVNLYPEPDGIGRRAPTVFRLGDRLHPGLAAEAARVSDGAPGILVEVSEGLGVDGILIGRRYIPTDGMGRVWVDLSDPDRIPTVSARAVLEGDAAVDAWRDRVVMIGSSASGVGDELRTATGGLSALTFQALAADALIAGGMPARPAYLGPAEVAFGAALGALLVLLLPLVLLQWKPATALGLTILCVAGASAAAGSGLLIDASFPVGVTLLATGSFVIADLRREIAARRQNEEDLKRHDAYMRNVVDASFDAIITLDGGGFVRTVNRGAGRLLGLSARELMGSRIQDHLAGAWAAELDARPKATLARTTREGLVVETGIRRPGEAEPVPGEVTLAETTTGTERIYVMVLRDVSGRRRAEVQAAAAAQRLRDAIDALSDGFALFDPQGKRVLSNDKFLELFPSGRPPADPVHGPADSPREQELAGGVWVRIDERRTSEGGLVGVYADITELKLREFQLADATRQAETASQAKSEFLASMSHELRTPLNAIIGFAEIIRDDVLGATGRERYQGYAGDISRSAGTLLRMIERILEFSRLEGTTPTVADEVVSLEEVAGNAIRDVSAGFVERGIQFLAESEAGLPPLRGDPQMLYQIVQNLLSNAAKFSENGAEVVVRTFRTPEGGIGLSVADTGSGIPEDMLGWVTQPFWQQQTAQVRGHGGVGLGMSIVKANVEAHAGSFEIDSTQGEGTTVTVRFPAARVLAAAEAPARGG